MTRETKIGLFIGMGVIILLGVVVSDHLSQSQKQLAPSYSELFKEPPPAETARHVTQVPAQPPKVDTPVLRVPGHEVQQPASVAESAHKPDTIVLDIEKSRPAIVLRGDAPADRGAFVPVEQPRGISPEEVRRLNELERRVGSGSTGKGPVVPVAPVSGPRYHVVTEADTLSSLARQYYGRTADWQTIYDANKASLPNPDRLKVGTKLQIPVKAQANPSPIPVATTTASPSDRYTVREGDTLADIAQDTLGSSARWEEILEANKDQVQSPRSLRIGMVLRLPKK